jgi:hypothetical protein
MMRTKKMLQKAAMMVLVLVMAGCSMVPPTQQPAAANPEAIKTEVAATVMAQMAQEAAAKAAAASPTAVPPTATTEPTKTKEPMPTDTAVPTLKAGVVVPTATKPATSGIGGGGGGPTATPTFIQVTVIKPYYGQQMKPRTDFDAVWKFKNVSTKTWTTEYYLQFEKGDKLQKSVEKVMFDKAVKPGEDISFTIDMLAPADPGIYVSYWILRDDNAKVIARLNVSIKVVAE